MSISATVTSKTKDESKVELTVEKSGVSSANLLARTWTVPKPAPHAKPKISEQKLIEITVTADGRTIYCKADLFIVDPAVTLALTAADDGAKSVTITIAAFGTVSVDTYPLSDKDFAAVEKFVADAKYPLAA